MRSDLDHTYHQVDKRVSMEFDWKRKPINPRVVRVSFGCSQREHLTFDTVPMQDHSEFTAWREAWEGFNKKPRRNLKSMKDFNDFNTYRQTKSYPDKEAAKYLHKVDGDLHRLRRDLSIAFKRQEAGFAAVVSRMGTLTHKDFCTALNACGVPCKITDIENVRNKPFKPHQTMPTDRVIDALNKLRLEYFRELDIDIFLTGQTSNDVHEAGFSVAA